jgi:hypothetical protein
MTTTTISSASIPVYTWGGYATGVALANTSRRDTIVFVTGRDYDGSALVGSGLSLKAGEHTAFSIADRFPQMKNQLGSIEFSPQGLSSLESGLVVLALRFNPSGPFTTVQPILGR